MKIELKDYEAYLNKLNEIITKLDNEEVSLSDSIALYKEGKTIADALTYLLEETKGRVSIIKDNQEFVINEDLHGKI